MAKRRKVLNSKISEREEERIQKAMMSLKGSETRGLIDKKRERFILTFVECLCNVSEACRSAGITRPTFYNWLEASPEFAQAVHDARESVLDKLESAALEKALIQKDTTMLIFLLKTQAAQRGYQENKKVSVEVTKKQTFTLGGTNLEF